MNLFDTKYIFIYCKVCDSSYINDSLGFAYEQISFQSWVSRWIPSVLVQAPNCGLIFGFDTRSSNTLSLKMPIRTHKCFQKEQVFLLPILVALHIKLYFSRFSANFLCP